MTKNVKPEYVAKVKKLSPDEIERLLSRMGGKLPRRLEKRKVSQDEALAMQLQLEDEQLHEWRKMMHILKEKEEAKKEAKPKKDEKPKKVAQTKKEKIPKASRKIAAPAKKKASVKAKV